MPNRPIKLTYLAQLDELPPYLVSSLARVGRRSMTQQDIADKTGWCLSKVSAMSNLKSWANVTIADADTFRIACGVDRKSERRHRWYVRRTLGGDVINSFNHLRKRGVRIPKFLRELTQNKV